VGGEWVVAGRLLDKQTTKTTTEAKSSSNN